MKILAVAVHPDDETLGCGGTLLKHRAMGDELAWLIITNVKREYEYSEERVLSRNKEIDQVAAAYGFSKVYNLEYKPAGLTSENQPNLIKSIGHVMHDFRPETIYLINRSDAHSDHRFGFQACFACTKPFRYPFIKRVLMYECISETELSPALPENNFTPNYFVDISEYIERKVEIMSVYESEISTHPFPRNPENIKAMACFRGASAGLNYAEAFILLRYIDK